MKLYPYLPPFVKINSKWIKHLNIRVKTTKLLEKSRGKSSWFWIRQWFLRNDIETTNKRKNRSDFIKSKNFHASKDTIKKSKRQSTEWKKIFANISDKGLVSRVYKELLQFNSTKTNNPT